MEPGASVSALVFGHSESKYFAVGKIDKDQVRNSFSSFSRKAIVYDSMASTRNSRHLYLPSALAI